MFHPGWVEGKDHLSQSAGSALADADPDAVGCISTQAHCWLMVSSKQWSQRAGELHPTPRVPAECQDCDPGRIKPATGVFTHRHQPYSKQCPHILVLHKAQISIAYWMRIYSLLIVILRIGQVLKHSDLNLRFPATFNQNSRSNSAVMTILLEMRQRQPYRDHQIGWEYTEPCTAAVFYIRKKKRCLNYWGNILCLLRRKQLI